MITTVELSSPRQTKKQNKVVQMKGHRLHSLDALRGFDMFWIVSGEGIFHGIASVIKEKYSLQQNAVDWQIATAPQLSSIEKFFVWVSNQLHHSVWNGFTFYDLIFPLFIFIAGVSMPYSFGKQLEQAVNKSIAKKNIYRSLIRRTIILILLGMVVNGALQLKGYEDTRFASVLGRIALSCFFAAIIYLNCRQRTQVIWFLIILFGYWAAISFVPVPGFGSGVLTPEGNLAGYVDRVLLPGKLHRVTYDPEGLLSTIPAIASAMLGIFTGEYLRKISQSKHSQSTAAILFLAGLLLLAAGWLWSFAFPINKNMWTSSFVLLAGGWSLILFSIFYLIIDVAGYKQWSIPFIWIGTNSILIYVAAHGMVNFESTSQFLFGGFINLTPAIWQPALTWMGVALIQLAALHFLFKKKWFLKL